MSVFLTTLPLTSVSHDRSGTEAHRSGSDHGTQKESKEPIEYASRKGLAERIVDTHYASECPASQNAFPDNFRVADQPDTIFFLSRL